MQFKYLLGLLVSALPLALAAELKNNAITQPIAGDVITAGEPYDIKWTNIKGDQVTITLVDGPADQVKPVLEITSDTPNTGVFTWDVPDDIPASKTYAIRITYNSNPADYNYSDRFTFENENVASSASVSSRAATSTAAPSTSSGSETETEPASTTASETEAETTTGAASSDAVTYIATETARSNSTATTVTRTTRSTSPAIETGMAPVDEPSSASRSIGGRSLIVAIAGVITGGVFVLL